MGGVRCTACGAENREGRRFCAQCGAGLPLACSACGFLNEPGERFCGGCGALLAAAGADAAGPPATRPGAPVADAAPASSVVPPARARFAAPSGYTPPHLAERILKDRAALEGERKQVTVLFADVSGFTSLSERLDPEDVHAVMNEAFERMLREIHRYEGTVNQFLGDGLMALFGAPVAHEDHARRAALAAAGMRRSLAEYRDALARQRGLDFRVRMGLNTGLVVVGAIGDNLRMDYTAVGDTTNVAARLQQLAEPDQILVGETTRRLIEPYFELRPLGPQRLRHRDEPVTAWELGAPRPPRERLPEAPLLGRRDTLTTLERALAAARGGRGQAVYVVGEPGIGKSRLVAELRRRAPADVRWLEGRCLSFGQSTAFLPVVEIVRGRLGVLDQDGEAEIVGKVTEALAPLGDRAAAIAPYARYLLAVEPGDPAVAAMDPMARRRRLIDALIQLILLDSRDRPVVLVVEDLHWIDDASQEWLGRLLDTLAAAAVLVVLTYRPTYRPPFAEHTYVSRLVLEPLDDANARDLLRATLDVDHVPDDLAAVIARKADGNPFFLEELARALIDTGTARREGRRLLLERPAATLTLPDRVQDVIAARLDRLREDQKLTVQVASVIGREFALRLLRRVAEATDRVEQALADLKTLEFVYERITPADLEYVFKHALTQDVAYASILHGRRRDLHARIGRAIEELYADRLDERLEELAHHFTRGDVWDRAARYARLAGDRAAALCLDSRAIEFYERALDALGRLPETADSARAAIAIRLAMRAPLWRGGHLDRLFDLFKEAEALATRHGETAALDTIYSFLVQYHWAKGQYDEAVRYGDRCLALAAARDDLGLAVTARYYLGWACTSSGRYDAALEHFGWIIEQLAGARVTERFGMSGLPYCGACGLSAWIRARRGDYEEARALLDRAERAAVAADHLYSRTVSSIFRSMVAVEQGAGATVIPAVSAALAVCRDKGFAGQTMFALQTLARAYTHAGRAEEAIALAQESIDLQDEANAFSDRSLMLFFVAEAQWRAGRREAAEATAREALAVARRQGERAYEADIRWLLGEVARARGDLAAARERLAEAEALARELGLRPLAERCRESLAGLA